MYWTFHLCGTNWLFGGTNWLLIGMIWIGTMSTIWPWNKMTGYRHAPSRLPMNKLKSLLQKTRKVTLFVWKSIWKNTPLSSEIHCYVKSRKGLYFRDRGARWKVGGLTIENDFFILKIEKRNKIIVFDLFLSRDFAYFIQYLLLFIGRH